MRTEILIVCLRPPELGRSAAGHVSGGGEPDRASGGAHGSRVTQFTASGVSSLNTLEELFRRKYVLASRHRARKVGSGLTVCPWGIVHGGEMSLEAEPGSQPSRAACTCPEVPHGARAGGCRRALTTAARRGRIGNPVGSF